MEWACGTEAQPDIRPHMSHVEAWLRYWDTYKNEKRERIGRAWKKTLRRIEDVERKGAGGSTEMRSAMPVCIVSLRRVLFYPRSPEEWVDEACGSMKIDVEEEGVARKNLLDNIAERLGMVMWMNVTKGEATAGLGKGTLSLETA